MPEPLSTPLRIAFLGFSEFERGTLASCFRLASKRTPSYEQSQVLVDADFLMVDVDHAPSLQLVLATERLDRTLCIGSHPPPGSVAWVPRPIDALHVMRELDAMVALATSFADTAFMAASAAADAVLAPPPPPLPRMPTPTPVLTPVPVPVPKQSSVSAPSAAQEPTPTPTPASAGPWALLVDDSDIALRFLETRLQPWGLQINRAGSSAQAVEMLERRSYDLIFLDVELGESSELDGLGLCQHIKQSPAQVSASVILVSAHRSELDRVRGALAGCDAYLGKPLNEVEMARVLQRLGHRANSKVTQPAPARPL